jgi:pimeloyl-ACP methyl ester carboxylesterase
MRIILPMLTLVAASTLSIAQVSAERAAGIDYDFVERPAHLPPTFVPPAGTTLRFLAIKAIDGERVEAALWQPEGKAVAMTTLIVGVHGSGGSFAGAPVGSISPALVAKGYGVLAINTRQHDERVNTDNFVEIRRDIEAAVYSARALGYRSIVLYGHSLGSVQIQYYAANNWDVDIKAVVLSGMFGNLPWKSRYMLVADEDKFRLLSEAAFKALRESKERDLLPLRMRRTGTEEEPLTGQHFLSYRAESSSTADSTYWIKRIPRPILMVRDAGDAIIAPFEPYTLLSAATSAGSLVTSIKYVVVPNPKGVNPRGHQFLDNVQGLADTITAWLGEQRL